MIVALGAVTPVYRRYDGWATARRQAYAETHPGRVRWGIQGELVTRLAFVGTGLVLTILGLLPLLVSA
ncbi:MAG: hypothetical protein QOG87_3876 [Actinomycetota bacterium]|jgi:hypothetical protein